MTDRPDGSEWRLEYPWGRKLPSKRIADLEARMVDVLRRERMLRDRFEERLVDFRRQIEAIDADIALARRCERDRVRRLTKELAYKLLDLGIDALDKARDADGDAEVYREILELYRITSTGKAEDAGREPGAGANRAGSTDEDEFVDPDLLDETIVDISDIDSERP